MFQGVLTACLAASVCHLQVSNVIRTCRGIKIIITNVYLHFMLPEGLWSHSPYSTMFYTYNCILFKLWITRIVRWCSIIYILNLLNYI